MSFTMTRQKMKASILAAFLFGICLVGGGFSHQAQAQSDLSKINLTLDIASGKRFDNAILLGNWSIFVFGYTYCPDICPTTLAKLAGVLDQLPQASGYFITVDPDRDNQKVLAAYCTAFHPRIIGLRGNPRQTKAAARQFSVFYEKVDNGHGGYSMDHSSGFYLVNPEGQLEKRFPESLSVDELAQAIRAYF